MAPDRIEREILIDAPPERVWTTLTEAEHLGVWFGDAGATVDLRPGGAMSLTFAKHGTKRARVERVEPPRLFSYRWTRASDVEPVAGNSTLGEVTLTPEGTATRLRVVESGFLSVEQSDEEKAAHVKSNTGGWISKLDSLQRHLARSAA